MLARMTQRPGDGDGGIRELVKRDPYWDAVKAGLIFLVILGHVVQYMVHHSGDGCWTDPMFKGIYMFHLPLFMLVSGYFAGSSIVRRGWGALPRYAVRLLIPSVFFSLLFLLVCRWKDGSFSGAILAEGVRKLWFLKILFCCFFCYLLAMWRNNILWRSVFLVLPMLGCLFPECRSAGKMFFFLWPFFLVGTAMRATGMKASFFSGYGLLFLPAAVLAFFLFLPGDYVYHTPWAPDVHSVRVSLLRTLWALLGGGAFLSLIYLLRKLGNVRLVQGVGQATLGLYVLQAFLFEPAFVDWRVVGLPWSLEEGACVGIALLILLCCYGFYVVTRRLRLFRWLFYGE